MLKKGTPTLILAVILGLFGLHNTSLSKEVEIILPPEGVLSTKVSVIEKKEKWLTVYAEEELKNRHYVLNRFFKDLEKEIPKVYKKYKKRFNEDVLSHCSKPTKKLPNLSLVFLKSFIGVSTTLRKGYFHPDNVGPIILSDAWDDQSVFAMVIHESVHAWCARDRESTAEETWLEEGFADFIVHEVLGEKSTQTVVSRYFKDPCKSKPYGGSLLWWVSKKESGSVDEFRSLFAAFHLGLRQDLFSGSLKDGAKTCKTDLIPELSITKPKAANLKNAVPFWKRAWGGIFLVPRQNKESDPSGYFIWNGPVPSYP